MVEIYRGWRIYYSPTPSPLWTACRGIEKDIYSYEGLVVIKSHIDKKMVTDALKKIDALKKMEKDTPGEIMRARIFRAWSELYNAFGERMQHEEMELMDSILNRVTEDSGERIEIKQEGVIIQAGKVEKVGIKVWHETTYVEGGITTFVDEHPKVKNITCSVFELGKTGLPLYLRMVTGKNASMVRGLLTYSGGIYAKPEFPNHVEVGDEYVIFAVT